MTRKGEPGRAVWLGIYASMLGSLIGGFFLVFGAVTLAEIAVSFGPWEYFSLFFFTLSIVPSLTEKSFIKGLISGIFGLLVASVGTDPIMGVPRFTFNTELLKSGFPFLPVLIGVYAFSQIMTDAEKIGKNVEKSHCEITYNLKVSHLRVLKEILWQPVNLIRSSLVGLIIGILPAVGGSAANILAYDQAKKMSRHPEKFGTGIPDGIIASESSNNANVGGSLITMMAFGIPGDAVTAVMLGALIIHGIQPGPLFIGNYPIIAYGVFLAYFLSTFIAVGLEWSGQRLFLKIVDVPSHILYPIVLVLCVVGSFALNNIIADVWTLYFFGILGYLMIKFGFPLASIVLGVILGPLIEQNLIRAIMTNPDLTLFIRRPVSLLFLLLSVLSVGVAIYQRRKQERTILKEG
jgi:putative tricarboxylic transport membrane protein